MGLRLAGSRPGAIAAILQGQMAQAVDEQLDQMASLD
jgi:hypothetical protein